MDLRLMLQEYMYRTEFKMDNDKIDCLNRLRDYSDNIDYVEMIECNVRIQTVNEVFRDLRNIIRLAREPPDF